jgi:plasmid maintenance system antidote protein VapI
MNKSPSSNHKLSVIHFTNEIKYLNARLKSEENTWGLMGKWADLAGCYRPQFSNILAEKASLTIEQAYRLANSLGLNEMQKEYFLLLVELRRSGSSEYSEYLEKK